MLTEKCGPSEKRNMYELLAWSRAVKMNSQALKKPLKHECCVDLFYSAKGQAFLALHCQCVAYDSGTALHAPEKTWMMKGERTWEMTADMKCKCYCSCEM